ncbi:hypothetical protein [Petropleomorpha daqingensis]|uniref:Uncharacterized protein n=1 Tax=Petropleomorpha daqingensis TaxID=2026353 RepID=A0A853CJ58_9ACTN|nr:hypothetical protein [Petropleomorpha daqingensis]NYJ07965.1 hypothetical protein [Petropleomorpha daqingensis]
MSERWEPDDDELLSALGEALQEEDAVPPRVTAMGKGLFSLYSLEAELAALEQGDKLLAGVRSTSTGARELDFTLGTLTLHVELSSRQLSGQVVPPQPGEIDVQTQGDRPRRVEVDEVGWFTVTPPPRGEFRLLFLGADGLRAVTDWISG